MDNHNSLNNFRNYFLNYKNWVLIISALLLIGLIIYFIKVQQEASVYQQKVEKKMAEFKQANPETYENLIKSLTAAEKTLSKNRGDYNAWVDKGVVLQTFGDFRGAEKAYLEAIKISKLARVPWNNLGSIYRDQGKHDKALWAYNNLVTNFPEEIETYLAIFDIYALKLNDEANAVNFIKQSIEKFKGDKVVATFYKHLAEYYEKVNKKQSAIEAYNSLIELDSKNKDYYQSKINFLLK